jgi:hypothetical protein
MVTLADPVSAPFRLIAALRVTPSPVKASDAVLTRRPAVAAMRKLDSVYTALVPTFTDDSDTHTVCSLALPPA